MNKLPDTLTETIKDNNFQEVITNFGEIAIDSVLDEGVLKEIPLLGCFFGLAKATMSIQDKLFTKKILTFLLQLKNTDTDSRRKQVEKIDNDPEYKTKVGEKLLYIIDKCEDNEKAIYLGQLFQCYIEEQINYEDFLRASKCIELTFLQDLKRFIKEKWNNIDTDKAGELVGSGLMQIVYSPPNMGFDGGYSTGSLKAKVSIIGKIIQDLLEE